MLLVIGTANVVSCERYPEFGVMYNVGYDPKTSYTFAVSCDSIATFLHVFLGSDELLVSGKPTDGHGYLYPMLVHWNFRLAHSTLGCGLVGN